MSYGPAAYGDVWQIEGGNRQLVSGLLAASGARVTRSARVLAVTRHPKERTYELEVAVRRSEQEGVRGGGEEQQTRRNALDPEMERITSLQWDNEEESREGVCSGVDLGICLLTFRLRGTCTGMNWG